MNLRAYPGSTRIPTCEDTLTVSGKTVRKKIPCFSDRQGQKRFGGVNATVYTANQGADQWHVLYAWRRNGTLYTLSEHVAAPYTPHPGRVPSRPDDAPARAGSSSRLDDMKLTRRQLVGGAAVSVLGAGGIYKLVDELTAAPERAVAGSLRPEQHLLDGVRVVRDNGVEVLVPPLHHQVVTATLRVEETPARCGKRARSSRTRSPGSTGASLRRPRASA